MVVVIIKFAIEKRLVLNNCALTSTMRDMVDNSGTRVKMFDEHF